MSKFEYGPFITDNGMCVAFNAEKYSREDAFKLARFELSAEEGEEVVFSPAWGHYGPYTDDDGERMFGYQLTQTRRRNSFPVMVFSLKGREWP